MEGRSAESTSWLKGRYTMISKSVFVVIALNTFALYAIAKIPYDQIEQLRRKTIAIRFASDNPMSKEIKSCKINLDFAEMGAKLSLIQDSSAKEWQTFRITSDDLHELDKKVQNCMARSSCQVYELFLSSATAEASIQPEAEILKSTLNKKTQTMTQKTYKKSWSDLPSPCDILKKALQ